ncbi:MAG: hypothetical protein QGH40_09725, partial [bacterium]|nr:hypothetical protein [bacterium]
ARLAACASSKKVVFFEGDGTVAGEFTSGESGLVGLCGPHDLGLIFTATGDRVFCLSPDGGIIWQQSLAVSSLSCGSGGDFLAVARPGGSFTILSGSGKMVYEGKVSGDILVSHVSDREMMVAFGTSREIICLTLGGFREDRFATSGSPTFVSCLAGGDVVWAVPDGVFKWRPESPDPQRLLRLSTPACCGAAAGNLVAIGTSGRDFFLLSPGQAALKVPVKSVPTAAAVSADGQWAAVGTRYRVCTLVPFERQRKPSYIKIKGRMEAVALDRTAGRAAFLVGSEVILCATGLISGAMGSADPGKCDIDGTSRLFEGELEFL